VLSPSDHLNGPPERLRAAGRAMPGAEIGLVDADGGGLAPGAVGEIVVRSGAVMKGYWKRPDATAEAIDADGWLRTGDIGRMDADGYLYVLDRAKDMIISGGENIYPTEVENVLYRHPDVVEAAVFGVPSDRWGEEPVAAVVLRAGCALDPEGLAGWCAGKLARFKIPRRYHQVAALPRNAGNKVLRRELRAAFAGAAAEPAAGGVA